MLSVLEPSSKEGVNFASWCAGKGDVPRCPESMDNASAIFADIPHRPKMADIFFSYSSKDRSRVTPIRDALVSRGFSVFWDQQVPANSDWDSWIRQRLNESKCAVVIWSSNSISSDNVRH